MQVGTWCHIYLLSFEVKGSIQMWTFIYGASFGPLFIVDLLKSIGHVKICWSHILNPPPQYQTILPIKSRHSLILSHPLPWPLGAGPAYMARCASSLTIFLLFRLAHSMTLTARPSWCELAAVGFVQQQQEEEQVNGRQAGPGWELYSRQAGGGSVH